MLLLIQVIDPNRKKNTLLVKNETSERRKTLSIILWLDVQRAGVGLPSAAGESCQPEEGRGACAHTLHGQNWGDAQPV